MYMVACMASSSTPRAFFCLALPYFGGPSQPEQQSMLSAQPAQARWTAVRSGRPAAGVVSIPHSFVPLRM